MFERLVDLTKLIYQKIDLERASMILFDTSGIEAWMILLTLTRLLMVLCLPTPLAILPSSRCTLTGIFAIPLNSVLSPMGLVLSGISLFITRIS